MWFRIEGTYRWYGNQLDGLVNVVRWEGVDLFWDKVIELTGAIKLACYFARLRADADEEIGAPWALNGTARVLVEHELLEGAVGVGWLGIGRGQGGADED